LSRLVAEEIDGKPVQARLVSALLLGTGVEVPAGKDVGGTFQHVPLCTSPAQIGCVVTYASFRETAPPPEDSLYGRAHAPQLVLGCTDPTALANPKGAGALAAYLAAGKTAFYGADDFAWAKGAKVTTPFVQVPGLLTARCVATAHGGYLAITVHGDPADPRVDDIPGDVVVAGRVLPDWGLHLIDVDLAQGNLIELVRAQARAYALRE
jgi:hypothetical protein